MFLLNSINVRGEEKTGMQKTSRVLSFRSRHFLFILLAGTLFLAPQQLFATTYDPITNFPAGSATFWKEQTGPVADYPNRIWDLIEVPSVPDGAGRPYYAIDGDPYVFSSSTLTDIPVATYPYTGDFFFYLFIAKNSATLESNFSYIRNAPYDTEPGLGLLGGCQDSGNYNTNLPSQTSFALTNSPYSYLHVIPCVFDGIEDEALVEYVWTSIDHYPTTVDALYGYMYTDEDLSFVDTEAEFNNLYDYFMFKGDIATSTTWLSGKTYIVSGNTTINSGATLTIEPGTIVKFDTSTSSSLTVNGTLNAMGDKTEPPGWVPVAFTSIKDDNIGNPFDINGDGASTTPAPGDWGGIIVSSTGEANIYGSIIRYAGAGLGAGIYNDGGTVMVASSTIVLNDTYGIYNESGNTTAYATDLGFQDYGLYVEDGTASITATSTIHDNSVYGIYNDSSTEINAIGNWWSTSTGPSSLYGSAVYGMVNASDPILLLHFVRPECPSPTCGAVINEEILYSSASTTFTSELNDAVFTWNSENKINLISTSTLSAELIIQDDYAEDQVYKGGFSKDVLSGDKDQLVLNTYYLNSDSSVERQHTITHELGHALGLQHSFTGNVLFHNQTIQTYLGPQDLTDYHYLWP